ncbi:hypothetical protein J4772_04625 [Cohnella sp. LGH]|uniref:hypothetical protein n=1 Tax=Cohnella sp. LGH TaxID=1619153 RepID=UPI001AD9D913|nr:hypothetical protein [Cohnella sp. LGH]QTH43715.1 hypothetical protein J4772_04625 [Cohnella sp. LGH]
MLKKLGVILLVICLSGVWDVIDNGDTGHAFAAEETDSARAAADFNYVISDFERRRMKQSFPTLQIKRKSADGRPMR